ncbi:MAG: mechanosensitive ion channel, partial [Acidobacteria bacterium]|nr:mechanosensitive ion channel [Acidobacteriota bacterium]NIQ87024.1 mechanosensitive ion channel [Acidobacteriota bacterium]
GTVEHIGLKTTRVRSLSGEQLVFSNSDLLGSRIRNYKRMAERRIVFSFGVIYQTPYEKLAGIPGMVREIIEAQESVRF